MPQTQRRKCSVNLGELISFLSMSEEYSLLEGPGTVPVSSDAAKCRHPLSQATPDFSRATKELVTFRFVKRLSARRAFRCRRDNREL